MHSGQAVLCFDINIVKKAQNNAEHIDRVLRQAQYHPSTKKKEAQNILFRNPELGLRPSSVEVSKDGWGERIRTPESRARVCRDTTSPLPKNQDYRIQNYSGHSQLNGLISQR